MQCLGPYIGTTHLEAQKAMLHRALWEAIPYGDRREKEYREFKNQFLEEVENLGRFGSTVLIQKPLFEELPDGFLNVETPQLLVSDYEILYWVFEKTNAKGKSLIEKLCGRHLFKRLLVFASKRRNQRLWEQLVNLRKSTGKDFISFQNKFQDYIVEKDYSIEDSIRTNTVMSKSITDEIVGKHAKGEILLLIDIPGFHPDSVYELSFRPEHRIYGPIIDHREKGEFEDSELWNNLSNQFLSSIGKIRSVL